MSNEPVLAAGTAAGLVGAVLTLLVAFGVHVTEDQQKAILAVVVLVVPIVAAIIARSKVTPVAKLEQVLHGPAVLEQIKATE